MSIVWGRPINGTSTIYQNITNFADCIQFCYDAKYCIVAYNRGYNTSTEGCQIFEYYNIEKIEKMTKATALGAKVGFKLIDDGTGCKNGTNPPTFAKNLANGEVENPSRPALKPGYNVTLTSGVWNLMFNGDEICYGMSIISLRSGGAICLSYFMTPAGLLQDTVDTDCAKSDGATLTGIDNAGELAFFQTMFMTGEKEGWTGERVVWLDGRRRKACQGSDWKTVDGCSSFDAFRFNDTTHTNTDFYQWEAGAPLGKECLVMWGFSTSKPARIGKVRDIDCNTTCTSSICPIGVSCWSPPM